MTLRRRMPCATLKSVSRLLVLALATACGGSALSEQKVAKLHSDTRVRNDRDLADALVRAASEHRFERRPEQEGSVYLQLVDSDRSLDTAHDGPTIIEHVAAPTLGLSGSEELVRITERPGAAPRLALLVASCSNGQSCGCFEPTTHLIAVDAKSRRTTIVRLRAVEEVRAVHQKGACGYGCGQPAPPRPPYVYWLDEPVTSLRVVDVPYPRRTIEVTCDTMVARP